MSDDRPLISVCVCTFRRPELLEGLLDAVFHRIEFPGPTEIIVVDNDASGSAREVVKKFEDSKQPLGYFEVPVQNISIARNKAVTEARGEWIALIDDDEQPNPDWLVCLFRCAIEMDADAVFGPVQPKFSTGAPQWMVDGRFFERRRFPSGTAISSGEARTGNVLMKAEMIDGEGEPFHPDFGLSGGEDSLLFRTLLADGRRFYWCDEAVVEEIVPVDRLSWQWLLKRSFRMGQTFARISIREIEPSLPQYAAKIFLFLRSILLMIASVLLFLINLPFGKARFFKWLRTLVVQFGKISSLFHFQYQEYRDRTVSSRPE